MPTFLITAPFPELWRGIEHEHLVLIDGHGLDGKPWLEGPNVEIAPVADILMEDIDKDGPIIDGLCDALLLDLAESLNRLHGLDESLRYWRMILAPWIRETVHSVYLRYKTLRGVFRRHPDGVLRRVEVFRAPAPPPDHFAAAELYHTPELRHWIYGLTEEVSRRVSVGATVDELSGGLQRALSEWEERDLRRGSSAGGTSRIPRTMAVVASNWSPVDRVMLHVGARRRPHRLSIRRGNYVDPIDAVRRTLLTPSTDNDVDLLEVCRSATRSLLPTALVESWSTLQECAGSTDQPAGVLLTNAGLQRNLELRVAAARHQRLRRQVVAVQEGGGYGTKCPPFLEQLEGDLPDAFISWGSASHSRGLVGGVAAARGISRRRSSRGHLLLLLGPTTSASKDFATIGRLPTSSYANDLCSLIDELPEWIQREVVVRTKSSFAEVPRKDRISQSKILGTRRVTLDSGTRTIGSVLRDTRLAVVTYHESLAPILISRGVPTILFWNSEYVASSASSRRVLAGLAKSGMYFSDPIQCGRHVGKIFDDPTAWWKSGPVCHARSEYEAAFATPVRSPGFGIGRLLQRETVESRSRETQ